MAHLCMGSFTNIQSALCVPETPTPTGAGAPDPHVLQVSTT